MAVIGYIYVGPLEHNAEFQRDLLRRQGASTIFEDISLHTSSPRRPELSAAIDAVDRGDKLLVWRLDRLGSTSASVLSLLELLAQRGVGVQTLAEQLDTGGIDGPTIVRAISAFNELERNLIRERTLVRVYAAKARGRTGGRPRALSDMNVERVLALRDQGASVREIAEELGTSRATVYRAIESATTERREPEDDRSITVTFPNPVTRELGDT
ncbi:recombinase family protein [Leifsonia sp. SIMBA_070]|uniref:recombinase family protein n=1 Tax=Leifsonia sp. SIMBA_070 TaxID=3085810 RepID=UPI00397DA2B2